MERIGIAASKIAKGNLILYNFFVILISILFALFVFCIAACCIAILLVIIASFRHGGDPTGLGQGWISVMSICMICLSIVIGLFALCAIIKNFKIRKLSE